MLVAHRRALKNPHRARIEKLTASHSQLFEEAARREKEFRHRNEEQTQNARRRREAAFQKNWTSLHTGEGFDLELVSLIADSVNIPVIASSGAGNSRHFVEVFQGTNASAALAAGIFHREEVRIVEIKEDMNESGIPTRQEAEF